MRSESRRDNHTTAGTSKVCCISHSSCANVTQCDNSPVSRTTITMTGKCIFCRKRFRKLMSTQHFGFQPVGSYFFMTFHIDRCAIHGTDLRVGHSSASVVAGANVHICAPINQRLFRSAAALFPQLMACDRQFWRPRNELKINV